MDSRSGMNPQEVLALAARISRSAEETQSLEREARTLIAACEESWRGPDADRFRQDALTAVADDLRGSADLLALAAARARRNVDEQTFASDRY